MLALHQFIFMLRNWFFCFGSCDLNSILNFDTGPADSTDVVVCCAQVHSSSIIIMIWMWFISNTIFALPVFINSDEADWSTLHWSRAILLTNLTLRVCTYTHARDINFSIHIWLQLNVSYPLLSILWLLKHTFENFNMHMRLQLIAAFWEIHIRVAAPRRAPCARRRPATFEQLPCPVRAVALFWARSRQAPSAPQPCSERAAALPLARSRVRAAACAQPHASSRMPAATLLHACAPPPHPCAQPPRPPPSARNCAAPCAQPPRTVHVSRWPILVMADWPALTGSPLGRMMKALSDDAGKCYVYILFRAIMLTVRCTCRCLIWYKQATPRAHDHGRDDYVMIWIHSRPTRSVRASTSTGSHVFSLFLSSFSPSTRYLVLVHASCTENNSVQACLY